MEGWGRCWSVGRRWLATRPSGLPPRPRRPPRQPLSLWLRGSFRPRRACRPAAAGARRVPRRMDGPPGRHVPATCCPSPLATCSPARLADAGTEGARRPRARLLQGPVPLRGSAQTIPGTRWSARWVSDVIDQLCASVPHLGICAASRLLSDPPSHGVVNDLKRTSDDRYRRPPPERPCLRRHL